MSLIIVASIIVLLLAWINKPIVNQIMILVLCLLFANRTIGVPDTENYLNIFTYSIDDSMYQYEYGYRYLNYICHDKLSMSFSTYLFVLSFFMLEVWYYCTSKLLPRAHYGLMFMIYMAFYGYYYDGVVLRNALGIILCYFGIFLLEKNGKYKYLLYVLLVLLAFSMHVATILFFIIPFLKRKLNKRILYSWVVLNLFLVFFARVDFVQSILNRVFAFEELSRLSAFGNDGARTDNALSIFFILNFVLSAIAVFYREKVYPNRQKMYNFFLNIFLFGVCLDCATSTINAASRAGGQFIYFSFIPLYLLCYESSLFNRRSGMVITYLLSFIYFFALIHYFPDFLNY